MVLSARDARSGVLRASLAIIGMMLKHAKFFQATIAR